MRGQILRQDDTIRAMKETMHTISRLTRQKHIFIQSFVESSILGSSLRHRKFIAKQIADLFAYPFARMIFHASAENKWSAEAFHAICDGKGATLTILRTSDGRIFGGFTSVSWELPKKHEAGFYKEDPNAFLFACEPHWQVYPVVEPKKAIYCDNNILAQFGYSDIVILNCPDSHANSYSYPSTAYPSVGIPKKNAYVENMSSMLSSDS